jgi:hypothetical protein
MARDEIILLVALYEQLVWNYEFQPDNHSKRALEEFLRDYPNITNYDERGNYVGAVANENGWVQ